MKWIIACCACLGIGLLCGAGPSKPFGYRYYTRTASVDLLAPEDQINMSSGDEVVGSSLVQTKHGATWVVLFRTPKE